MGKCGVLLQSTLCHKNDELNKDLRNELEFLYPVKVLEMYDLEEIESFRHHVVNIMAHNASRIQISISLV